MVTIEDRVPTAAEQRSVAESVGWDDHFDWASLPASLAGSLHGAVAMQDGVAVGVGRLVGDGVRYFYLQDVMVRPEAADQGIVEPHLSSLAAGCASLAPRLVEQDGGTDRDVEAVRQPEHGDPDGDDVTA